MTNVLPFPRVRDSRPAAFPPGHSAAILLFTGIRYERHADAGPQAAAPDDQGRDDNMNSRRRKARRRA